MLFLLKIILHSEYKCTINIVIKYYNHNINHIFNKAKFQLPLIVHYMELYMLTVHKGSVIYLRNKHYGTNRQIGILLQLLY